MLARDEMVRTSGAFRSVAAWINARACPADYIHVR
jgi:hypothetical protein